MSSDAMVSRQQYEVSDLISRNILLIGDGYRAKNVELGAEGIPFLRAGNIRNDEFDFKDVDFMPNDRLSKVGNKISRPGDIVFTSKGTVGRFAYVREETQPFVYSPQLCFWRVYGTDTIEPRYLLYWMQGPEFTNQCDSVKGQTDMAEYVSLKDQRNMKITLPPLPEQRAIARILSTLDDKIKLNHRMNATLKAMARAIFKSWFVDFDPVRAKMEGEEPAGMDAETAALFPEEFVEVDGREVPAGWGTKDLDEIATYINGLALQKYPPEGDDYLPVIKIAQLRKGSSEGADKASATLDPAYIIDDGDLIFSWSGSLIVALWCGDKGALNQHLFKVVSEHYPKWFYYLWTLHHLPDFQAIAASKATTMGHIRRHNLSEAKVFVPPPQLLGKMDQTFAPLIEMVIANSVQSRTLAALRDTLLPKLISGEIRVPDTMLEATVS